MLDSVRVLASVALALCLSSLPARAHAAERPVTAADLDELMGASVPGALRRWHVPGAVVVVVENGEVLFSRGYGSATLDPPTPMLPDQTDLRVLSLSKPVTALAIMQLWQQGRLRLDDDVNTYLRRVQVKDPFRKPITVASLLTHTSGVDNDQRQIGGAAHDPTTWLPLDRYVARRAPESVWPPGEQFVYSNMAYDLLGLIIEEVSGEPFPDYMRKHVLEPLDMRHSSYDASVSLPRLAETYHKSGSGLVQVDNGLLLDTPAAGLTTTGTDLAHVLVLLQRNGRYGDTQIVSPETTQGMLQPHFSYDSEQPGMTYGWREALSPRVFTGHRELESPWGTVLWHQGGGPRLPSSLMYYVPDLALGVFIHANSDEYGFIQELLDDINTRYDPLPERPSSRGQPGQFTDDLQRFGGVYRSRDYSSTTVARLLLLQTEDLPEVITGNKTLGIRWLAGSEPQPLVRIAPLVFESEDARFRFMFLEGHDGTITGLLWGNLFVLEKVDWFDTVTLQRTLFAAFLLAFAVAALSWRFVSSLGSVIALLNGSVLVTIAVVLPRSLDLDLQFGMPPALWALFAVPMLTTVLLAPLVISTALEWRAPGLPLTRKIGGAVFSALAVAFVPFVMHWNLLGFHW